MATPGVSPNATVGAALACCLIATAASKRALDASFHLPQLAAAANAGEPLAKELWDDIGLKLGVGLVNAIWLINPDRIVLGGGVAQCGDLLLSPCGEPSRAIQTNLLGKPSDRTRNARQ